MWQRSLTGSAGSPGSLAQNLCASEEEGRGGRKVNSRYSTYMPVPLVAQKSQVCVEGSLQVDTGRKAPSHHSPPSHGASLCPFPDCHLRPCLRFRHSGCDDGNWICIGGAFHHSDALREGTDPHRRRHGLGRPAEDTIHGEGAVQRRNPRPMYLWMYIRTATFFWLAQPIPAPRSFELS